jgi:DNA repair protein RadC
MKKLKYYAAQSDADLLSTITRQSKNYCREQLVKYGSLHDLHENTGLIAAALELNRRYLYESIKRSDALCSPAQTRNFLSAQLSDYPHEVFAVLFLDNRNRVISVDKMFNGTIDGASVYPREIVRAAINHNAAAVIFAHNHPSGLAEPSHADEQITKRLKEALALIDVRVLDHFVVAGIYQKFLTLKQAALLRRSTTT